MRKFTKPCTIDGCSGFAIARGYCSRHYSRWKKHRDPVAGRTREGAVLEWLEAHADHVDDGCLVFPFARRPSGYGAVKFRGHIIGAHRAMCFIAHGDPPSPDHVAAHSCGRGTSGCVNPHHLRWATQKENAEDLLLHRDLGIAPLSRSNLTKTDREAIVSMRGKVRQKEVGRRFGISESAVCRIQRKALAKGLA